ncbi:MAG TPA: tetratricopeptide repeat protein [Candidatus Eisenbacteria bacterium]|nr:tetratricopeptide repeat protein [Candidatus Eisenbacteria bacterium]
MKLFTTGEVAKILNLSGDRVRRFVRLGFLVPSRQNRQLKFTFQDLLLLKTAKALIDSRVAPKTISRMLASLRRRLPESEHLSKIKIYADGRRVVVWDGKSRWQPDSGQFVFNFDAASVLKKINTTTPVQPRRKERRAEEWFNLGLEAEATSVADAMHAYRRALELDPTMADAHLNLGKLYHDSKQWAEAETHYRAAAARAPGDATARFNLGVLMEDLKRFPEAIRYYKEAIERDPSLADAHYNLGLLFESLGQKPQAIAHLRAARKLYGRR